MTSGLETEKALFWQLPGTTRGIFESHGHLVFYQCFWANTHVKIWHTECTSITITWYISSNLPPQPDIRWNMYECGTTNLYVYITKVHKITVQACITCHVHSL